MVHQGTLLARRSAVERNAGAGVHVCGLPVVLEGPGECRVERDVTWKHRGCDSESERDVTRSQRGM